MKSLTASSYINDSIKRFFEPSARTLDLLQAIATEGFEAFGKSMIGAGYDASKYYVLYGLVDSTPAGPSHTISDGVIFMNGEYILVTGAVINPVATALTVHIQSTAISGDPAKFTDGFTQNVHLNNAGTVEDNAIGGAWIDFSLLVRVPEVWKEVGVGANPAFTNSWANNGAGYNTAAFRKLANGFIALKGVITSGASNNSAFTLPAGYRPIENMYLPLSSPGATEQVYVIVKSDGTVKPQFSSGTIFSLDGLQFATD